MKPVYAQGVVYCRCHRSLLWYDPVRDRAGAFALRKKRQGALPKKRQGTLPFLDDIGMHEGSQLSCTRLGEEALELWLRALPCGPWLWPLCFGREEKKLYLGVNATEARYASFLFGGCECSETAGTAGGRVDCGIIGLQGQVDSKQISSYLGSSSEVSCASFYCDLIFEA
ncbi:uncharacterized protein LOC109713127 isoform X2 [Ananas comosus]|uniref:Uncharacterized protein LOC109713127 isoform X2 n=1 Tax=Ananas comosus TaxID=4615 RepID=A0A6P5FGU1_ANACO|nr:uncharacterized protein LOC109713127 isoform X2 [Ananas comosus]